MSVAYRSTKRKLRRILGINDKIWLSYPVDGTNSFEEKVILEMVELFKCHVKKRNETSF